MGLKSTVKPGPIVVQPESKDTTPSVTPMRPTPLVGKWCDLPWAGEDLLHRTPQTNLATASLFLAEAPAPVALSVGVEKPAPVPTTAASTPSEDGDKMYSTVSKKDLDALSLALSRPIPSDDELDVTSTPAPPLDRAGTAEPPSSDDGMEDLYLATPMQTFGAEDFEVDAQQTAQQAEQQHVQNFHPQQSEATDVSSNAANFVDFRRLQQQQQQQKSANTLRDFFTSSKQQQQQQQRNPAANNNAARQQHLQQQQQQMQQQAQMVQVQYYAQPQQPTAVQPVVYSHSVYSQQYPQRVHIAPVAYVAQPQPSIMIGVAARPQQAPVVSNPALRPRQGVVVLISRFPPPPPPSRTSMQTMLRTGTTFDAYYQILMRWYARVARSVPKAHPTVVICPPAEEYLTDFEGWVTAIELWWTENFARRARNSKKRAAAAAAAAAAGTSAQ
ncbi:Hypothetical protein, putative [Bodo saltans]|uniref:Uncharacterized protein n=1 Tax=Bodo saltans TaxID=75058 RepID=A0A0S4J5I9_BODSA|nr:Hypothetical protein, putative [Bodo saltans]|eukprot:CUG84891.1 Hypothetical protein, putative [Bodo saltans]